MGRDGGRVLRVIVNRNTNPLQVVGIEVLYLSKRAQPVNLMDFQFETRPKKLAPAR